MKIRVAFVGNLGTEPEEKFTASGKRMVQFSVAVNDRKPVQGTEEWADNTTWFRVRVMGEYACDRAQTLNKGNRVLVNGKLDASTYVTKDGETRMSLDVFADDVDNLTPREPRSEGAVAPSPVRPVAAVNHGQRAPVAVGVGRATELDDLPF